MTRTPDLLITNSVKMLKMSVFSPFVGFLLGKFRVNLLLYPFFPATIFPVVGQQVGQKKSCTVSMDITIRPPVKVTDGLIFL